MMETDLYTEYKGVYVPKFLHTPESLKYYEDFTFRQDDVVIVTYPKSGHLCHEKPQRCVHLLSTLPWDGLVPGEPVGVDEFMDKFLSGKIMFGLWFDHVKGWLSAKDQDHILYITYEEMLLDLKGSVTKMSQFLGKSLSPDVTKKIADHCVFKNMKQNKMSNYSLVPKEFMDQEKSEFLRKGIAGDWKNLLTVAQAAKFDAVYKEKMKDINLNFVWD